MSDDDPKSLGDILPGLLPVLPRGKPLTRVQRRLLERGRVPDQADDPDALAYQHSVFCQTSLPYRDPGDKVRIWERTQGAAALRIEAGAIADSRLQRLVEVGLPWGTKPRLVLAHINGEALRQGKNVIEIEDSLSAFVRRIRGFQHGREIRMFKDQLGRLSAATIRLAFFQSNSHASQINTQIITACELWLTKDERQRVLWPSTIALSLDYFSSLQEHAVPLNESDLAALAHSAMALDIYSWLAQRLHRIDQTRPQFIPWKVVKEQFGYHYKRMCDFKTEFRKALGQVLARYQRAHIDQDSRGLTLRNSPPPVTARAVLIRKS